MAEVKAVGELISVGDCSILFMCCGSVLIMSRLDFRGPCLAEAWSFGLLCVASSECRGNEDPVLEAGEMTEGELKRCCLVY